MAKELEKLPRKITLDTHSPQINQRQLESSYFLNVVGVIQNTKIPVFFGLSEGCVYLILSYVADVLRNTKIRAFIGLSEGFVYLILSYVKLES
jgi:hypothetical protein